MEHSNFFPDSFHRVSVKGLYVRDGKILLLKESPKVGGKWELPSGGLNFGEEIHAGLVREIKEETSLKVSKIAKRPIYVWTNKHTHDRNLEWFYSMVVAYRIELEDLNFTPSEECEALGFFSKEELKDIKLNTKTKSLLEIFNPEDFKEEF